MAYNSKFKEGQVCRHHSGKVYTIVGITNTLSTDTEKFPIMVVYRGANGHLWSRRIEEFNRKFEILFDGTNLAPPIPKEYGCLNDKPN